MRAALEIAAAAGRVEQRRRRFRAVAPIAFTVKSRRSRSASIPAGSTAGSAPGRAYVSERVRARSTRMSSHRTVEVPNGGVHRHAGASAETAGRRLRDRRRVALDREVDVGDARLAAQEVADRPADEIERDAGGRIQRGVEHRRHRSGTGTAAWR